MSAVLSGSVVSSFPFAGAALFRFPSALDMVACVVFVVVELKASRSELFLRPRSFKVQISYLIAMGAQRTSAPPLHDTEPPYNLWRGPEHHHCISTKVNNSHPPSPPK